MMRFSSFLPLLALFIAFAGTAQPNRSKERCAAYDETTGLSYSVDLRFLTNDQLTVEVDVRNLDRNTVIFCMPKIVPGIYGAMDFGKLVEDLTAFDAAGKSLKIEQLDENRWKIRHAKDLRKIVYRVNDGWEEFNETDPYPYLSTSSTFREDTVFVINHNALFGYIAGSEDLPVYLAVHKPAILFGATSLPKITETDTLDTYWADSYHALVDQPILYSNADVSSFRLGDVDVSVALYSGGRQSLAAGIAASIQPLMEHQRAYLGGELPVKAYTFLLYHNENPEPYSYRWDGLEHANSTMILMYTAFDPEMIKKNVYGVASHEFFHTMVPLGIHSEEIAQYDFNHPKLSRHLWLYEGMTEYFTIHMPVKEHLISMEEFQRSVAAKAEAMRRFTHEHSLTYLSTHAMEFQDQYMDFYSKGTLFNLCLDIRLRELSNGAYGVQNLITDLMKEYGPDKPFKDSELFGEIARISHQPELRNFFKRYVEGTEPLPLAETFRKVGMIYKDEETCTIKADPAATPAELSLRKAWIGY